MVVDVLYCVVLETKDILSSIGYDRRTDQSKLFPWFLLGHSEPRSRSRSVSVSMSVLMLMSVGRNFRRNKMNQVCEWVLE